MLRGDDDILRRLAEQRPQGAGNLLAGEVGHREGHHCDQQGFQHILENDRRLGDTHRQQNPGFSFAAADGHGEDENNQNHAYNGNDNDEGSNQGIGIGECVGNILIYLVIGSDVKVVPVDRGNLLHFFNHAI